MATPKHDRLNMERRDAAHKVLTDVRIAVKFGTPATAKSLGDLLGVAPDEAVENAKTRAQALIQNNYWPPLRDYIAHLRAWCRKQ